MIDAEGTNQGRHDMSLGAKSIYHFNSLHVVPKLAVPSDGRARMPVWACNGQSPIRLRTRAYACKHARAWTRVRTHSVHVRCTACVAVGSSLACIPISSPDAAVWVVGRRSDLLWLGFQFPYTLV